MEKVQIYNTQEEMWELLGQGVDDNNFRARETLDDVYEKAMLEYKEKSGFNERFIKAQEKLKKEKPYASTFSPNMVHLPDDEQKNFGEQYHDLGKDLELTALVQLFVIGNEYYFDYFEEGSNGFGSVDGDEECKKIASLVNAVENTLQQLKGQFFGAKLTPLFYTTREEVAVVPEDISNDPEEYLREIKEEIDEDSDLLSGMGDTFLDALRELAHCKDKIRGLTSEECAEFEKLFYKQDPNTP